LIAQIAHHTLKEASLHLNLSGLDDQTNIIVLFVILLSFLAVLIIVSVQCDIIILSFFTSLHISKIKSLSCSSISKLSFFNIEIISNSKFGFTSLKILFIDGSHISKS
jgi:hypothetical protein